MRYICKCGNLFCKIPGIAKDVTCPKCGREHPLLRFQTGIKKIIHEEVDRLAAKYRLKDRLND